MLKYPDSMKEAAATMKRTGASMSGMGQKNGKKVRATVWLSERDQARLKRIMDHYDVSSPVALRYALVKANLYIQDEPKEPF